VSDVTRRDALKMVPATGLVAMAGGAADVKDANAQENEQDKADRKRVMAAGLTADEADCWELTGKAAGKFFALPKLHVMDDHEVAHAIHIIQHKLLARPAYRKYLELAKKAEKKAS
jgi:hypothetical protein